MFRSLLLVTAFISGSAFAAPLITKLSVTGANAKPEVAKLQKCEVYADKITVTTGYGLADGSMVTAVRDIPVTLSANFQDLITASVNDKVYTSTVEACGFPETTITAADGTMLYDTGTCEHQKILRQGAATTALGDFLSSYCPRTY